MCECVSTHVVRTNASYASPMPGLATPAAGRDRDQWLRCAAACLANDEGESLNRDQLDRDFWISLAASAYCGTSRRACARSSVKEEKEKKEKEKEDKVKKEKEKKKKEEKEKAEKAKIDREFWISLAADCLRPGVSTYCGTSRRACARLSVQEEKEREASEHGVACLLDPGSNAHLTNVRGALKAGSVVPCHVEVQGLSGAGQRLYAKEQGTHVYRLSENVEVDLNDTLFVSE